MKRSDSDGCFLMIIDIFRSSSFHCRSPPTHQKFSPFVTPRVGAVFGCSLSYNSAFIDHTHVSRTSHDSFFIENEKAARQFPLLILMYHHNPYAHESLLFV